MQNGTELNPKPAEGNASATASFVRERLSERGTRSGGEAGRQKRVNGDRGDSPEECDLLADPVAATSQTGPRHDQAALVKLSMSCRKI